MNHRDAPSIVVIGAGAIGGVSAALLKKAGYDPVLVTKHPETARLAGDPGLHISGLKGSFFIQVKAITSFDGLIQAPDVVLHATRANECEAVARALVPHLKETSAVVSLQNGMCEEALREIVGADRIFGCVTAWGATHLSPGNLEVTSGGEFVLGTLDGLHDDRLLVIESLLNCIQPTRISRNIFGELYSKLVVNSCINTLGVITGETLGRLLAVREIRRLFTGLIREAIQVSNAKGLRVEPAAAGKLDFYRFLEGDGLFSDIRRSLFVRAIGLKYRRIRSSSLQALERGRKTEIDFLNGYICRQAHSLDIRVPLHETAMRLVREIETGTRPIQMTNLHEFRSDKRIITST